MKDFVSSLTQNYSHCIITSEEMSFSLRVEKACIQLSLKLKGAPCIRRLDTSLEILEKSLMNSL